MSKQTLFHVTHAKAGSTWLTNIFVSAFGRRRCAPRIGGKADKHVWKSGKIYPAMFLSYEDFKALEGADDGPCFFVVRDVRDTLVSLYFSMRYSHSVKGFEHIEKFRNETEGMDDLEGVAHTFATRSRALVKLQESWLDSGERIVRYEDLLSDAEGVLTGIFEGLNFEYSPASLKKAIAANSFEKKFGRALGEKDNSSHGRQGAPGDWKNYRTERLDQIIEEKFSDVLAKAGYERE